MITIKVTQQDIDNGRPNAHLSCPVALAAKRVLSVENPDKLYVFGTWMSVYDDPFANSAKRSFSLPREARDFILSFDKGQSVKPFSFTVKED